MLILTGYAARRQILLLCLSNHLSSGFFPRRGHPFINIVSGLSSKMDNRNTSRACGRLPVLKYKKTKHVFEWLVYRTGLHLRQRLFGRVSVSSLSVSDRWEHIIRIAVIGQVILASWRIFESQVSLDPSIAWNIIMTSGFCAAIVRIFRKEVEMQPPFVLVMVDLTCHLLHILYGLKGWITTLQLETCSGNMQPQNI